MSDPAVELIQRAFGLYRERDFDGLAAIIHREVVAVLAVPLGAKHVYHGRDEVLGMLRERESQYADYQAEARTFTAAPGGPPPTPPKLAIVPGPSLVPSLLRV